MWGIDVREERAIQRRSQQTNTEEPTFADHVIQLQAAAKRLKLKPADLIGNIARHWFSLSYPLLKTRALPSHPAARADPNIRSFGAYLAKSTLLDSAYWLSSAYAQLVGNETRKSLSMYFTPPSLTARLLDDLASHDVRFDRGTFCDPACGGAAFLVPVAMRMRRALRERGDSNEEIIAQVSASLIGFDLDETLCGLSKLFLRAVLYDEISSSGVEPKFNIRCGDALKLAMSWRDKIDVLVCNPPYRKMGSDEVNSNLEEFGELINAQPNIYGLFLALGVRLVKKGGTCAFVTPTSFLSGRSFSKLRCFLMQEAHTRTIGIVGERSGVFIDVLQETALTILRRRHSPHQGADVSAVSVVSPNGDYISVGKCSLPNSGAAWPIPRVSSDVALIENSSKLAHRIKDYGYTVRVGHFVWNRDKNKKYTSEAKARTASCEALVPLVWSSDIGARGVVEFDGSKKKNGEWRFVDLKTWSHPSIVRRPSVVLQRVTSNDQPRRLIAGRVPSTLLKRYGGFIGENHTVILEQESGRALLSPGELVELFRSTPVDRYFRCISGATNVSVFELSQLPLPDPAWLRAKLREGESMEAALSIAMQGKQRQAQHFGGSEDAGSEDAFRSACKSAEVAPDARRAVEATCGKAEEGSRERKTCANMRNANGDRPVERRAVSR